MKLDLSKLRAEIDSLQQQIEEDGEDPRDEVIKRLEQERDVALDTARAALAANVSLVKQVRELKQRVRELEAEAVATG